MLPIVGATDLLFSILLVVAQTPQSTAPLWLTFDVLNPRTVGGHRVLHLEDVVGPRRRSDIPGLPSARAMVIFTTDVTGCDRREAGLCATIANSAMLKELQEENGLVLALILAEGEGAARAKKEIPHTRYPFPVAIDVHGLLRRRLGVDRPGVFLVINSEAKVVKLSPPMEVDADAARRDRFLEEVRASAALALRRDRGEEASQ